MAERAQTAADVTRLAGAFARAMTVALRSWGFYPPEHPAVAMAVERVMSAATDACADGMMQVAVAPHAPLLDGMPLDSSDLAVVECAELLHDRDILQLTMLRDETVAGCVAETARDMGAFVEKLLLRRCGSGRWPEVGVDH